MHHLVWALVGIIVAGVAAYVTVRVLLGRWMRAEQRRAEREASNRCTCGYDLTGVDLPRCPECGRAMGFAKSFEELGLTRDEVNRLAEVRRRRQQQAQPDR